MRILLIEDDTILGAAVRDHIAGDGHSADWVGRLDLAAEHLDAAPYDLILLDLMLPDGRGIPFLRALRRRGDVTPVIILTALDQISDRIEGLNAGADDYLTKPFDLAELSAGWPPWRGATAAIPIRWSISVSCRSIWPPGRCCAPAAASI